MVSPSTRQKSVDTPQGFLTVKFAEVEKPGIYVTQHGEMFRIPNEALAEGHSPLIHWETRDENLVTRVSEDPYAAISKCRQLATDCDLPVNF